jgi:acyl-CoA thioesterase FadM
MIHYWFTIIKILLLRKFQPPVKMDQKLERTYRVRLFDCDGLRVMTASKYTVHMDFIRWELIARSKLYDSIVKRRLAPSLGSQKIIYRKPLKIWSRFQLVLETVGWDDKWVYHTHTFKQDDEVKAIGITRALIWKRDVPQTLAKVIKEAGGPAEVVPPPEWVMKLFDQDKQILTDLTER